VDEVDWHPKETHSSEDDKEEHANEGDASHDEDHKGDIKA